MSSPINHSPSLETAQHTLVGDRHDNQDRCLVVHSGDVCLLALGDGMGGHPMGDLAAQIFVDVCEREIYRIPRPIGAPMDFLPWVLAAAHREIQQFGAQQLPPVQPRTTAVLALIQEGICYWAHTGDSRIYLFRQGNLLFRSSDHSYVERLRQRGLIDAGQLDLHPQRNYVTRCLGGNGAPAEPDTGQQPIQEGDIILLCSDGLWQSVNEEFMCGVLFNEADIGFALRLLVEEAVAVAFPGSDNVTVVAGRVPGSKSPRPNQARRPVEKSSLDGNLSDTVAALAQAVGALEDPEADPE
ncbi:MAG: serine/threonine-protein phosphatase [Gammaproteobacteria bacterium]|nr:serine/threonine-protein phosphatase [Gammaproteobacteria bacterium]